MPYIHVVSNAFSGLMKIDTACSFLANFHFSLNLLILFFFIAKGDNFVIGIPPSLIFKTINRDHRIAITIEALVIFL